MTQCCLLLLILHYKVSLSSYFYVYFLSLCIKCGFDCQCDWSGVRRTVCLLMNVWVCVLRADQYFRRRWKSPSLLALRPVLSVREGVFGGIAWERQKKKARMIDCHWDSEGDVYGCHCRMNMETYCVHLISDKVRFEFLREVHLILSFWDLIICGDNVTAQKSYLYSLLSLKLTDNHVVTCLLSILSKNPSDRWLKEL